MNNECDMCNSCNTPIYILNQAWYITVGHFQIKTWARNIQNMDKNLLYK